MHRAAARKTIKDIRAGLGASGFLHAYQLFGKTGEMPKSQRLRELVVDLTQAVAAMRSLELDYARPAEDLDWEPILLDARNNWPRNLTTRWYPLFVHDVQHELVKGDARFKICPAGRRSGKTERAMRYIVWKALSFTDYPDGLFFCAAPTHDQAKEVFWEHLKAFVPARFVIKISESKLWIRLINGARIMVVGVDKPQRIEGRPIDGMIIDEYGDTKEKLWGTHALPALNTIGREGWAWIIGVPRGARHYKELFEEARDGDDQEYASYTWFSAEILSAKQIKAIRAKTDDLTWAAEWESSFETTMERIYYAFQKDLHCEPLTYDPNLPLALCFDFGTKPGVALMVQEQVYAGARTDIPKDATFTAVLDEVHIPIGSTTERVCARLLEKGYGSHPTIVRLYGDASGGAKKSSSVKGSDWDLVKAAVKPVFTDRLHMKVRAANPAVVSRTSSVNSRLFNPSGVHMLVDPVRCPHTVIDLQDVVPKEGTREIDKDKNKALTHLSDALGYYIEREWSVGKFTVRSGPL